MIKHYLQLDSEGEFTFMICHVESASKLYVHPVQETTMMYDHLTNLQCVGGEATGAEVVPGSVWVVVQGDQTHRVVVTSVDSAASSVAAVMMDYGTPLENIPISQLHRAADSWVRDLPGLAVPCHLVNIPDLGAVSSEDTRRMVEDNLDTAVVYRARMVDRETRGIIIFLGDTTLNQKMAAHISGAVRTAADVKVDWDPLEDNFEDLVYRVSMMTVCQQ